ncbi:10600_t:CDS:2, partial [Scutellospora calospora]
HKKNSNKNTNARTPSESGSSTTKVFTENIPNYNGSSVTTNVTDEESINSGQRDIPNYNGLTDEESVNSGQRDNPNYNGLSDTTNVTDGESVKSGHRENGKYYLKSHKSNHSNHSIDMPKKDSTATDLVVQEKLHKVEDNVDTAITNQSSHVSDDNTTNEGVRSIPLSPQLDHLPVIQGSNMSENPRKSLDANESGSPLVDQELKQANTSLPSVANNGAIVSRELSRELLFSKNLYIGQVEQLPSIYLTFYYLGWYTEAIFERIANSLNIVDQHTGIPLSRLFLWMFSLKSWLGIKNEDLEKLEAAKKSE